MVIYDAIFLILHAYLIIHLFKYFVHLHTNLMLSLINFDFIIVIDILNLNLFYHY